MNGKRFSWQVRGCLYSLDYSDTVIMMRLFIVFLDFDAVRFTLIVIQGIAKLPFIEEKLLLASTRKLEQTLTVRTDSSLEIHICIFYIRSNETIIFMKDKFLDFQDGYC